MVVAYTCRYSSRQLNPLFQSVAADELGIKDPLGIKSAPFNKQVDAQDHLTMLPQ